MLRAAVAKAERAGVAPAPFVAFTQAPPSSPHTLAICGMFGIGTPPLLARPNWARTGSVTLLPAVVFAGKRLLAAARSRCEAAPIMYRATRSLARLVTPCAVAYLVTMKPWTPRNGTAAHLIFGTWMIRKLSPLVLSVSDSHGPVIQ